MNYVNQHDVRFTIYENSDQYTIKFYPVNGSKWPRIFRKFHCPDDERRREMFWILNTSHFCSLCRNSLIDDSRSTCRDCITLEASKVSEDQIAECPVCYNKMFRVNGSRRSLACRHELCVTCMRRMMKPHWTVYIPPAGGPARQTCTIACPLCRATGVYDYSLNILASAPPTV